MGAAKFSKKMGPQSWDVKKVHGGICWQKDLKWNPASEEPAWAPSFLFQLSLWKCHLAGKPREHWCFEGFSERSHLLWGWGWRRQLLMCSWCALHIKTLGCLEQQPGRGFGLAGSVLTISKQELGHFASSGKDPKVFHQSQSRNKDLFCLTRKTVAQKTLDRALCKRCRGQIWEIS